eukprot:TRINITY_DN3186_c0_g1_i2.p1 TRINITY_DN3186_c0_g1~~TRINITY_DN3186_c0_g1_i2.p1  ORF type:complete len:1064 (+),score=332.87 TRINITY_DN3186_c0_g1_i2:30-3221(+)
MITTLTDLVENLHNFAYGEGDLDAIHKYLLQIVGTAENAHILFDILINDQWDEKVRQLSGLLLRKNLISQWIKLSAEVHENIKSSLLEIIAEEESYLIQQTVAGLVSTIASFELLNDNWDELLPFIFEPFGSVEEDDPARRAISIKILTTLLDNTSNILRESFKEILECFMVCLGDEEYAEIRLEAVNGLDTLFVFCDELNKQKEFLVLFERLAETFEFAVDNKSDALIQKTFYVLENILSEENDISNKYFRPIIIKMLEYLYDETISEMERTRCLAFISFFLEQKVNIFITREGPMVEQIHALVKIAMLSILSDESIVLDEDGGSSATVAEAAARLYGHIVALLPEEIIYPLAKEVLNEVNEEYSEEEEYHHALHRMQAFCMGMLAQGCSSLVKEDISSFLDVILPALLDDGLFKIAFNALIDMCDNLAPEIYDFVGIILTSIDNLLTSVDVARQKLSWKIVISLTNGIYLSTFQPYVDSLLNRIEYIFQNEENDLELLAIVVSACTGIIETLGKSAGPKLMTSGIMQYLFKYLELTEADCLVLRARATEAFGMIILSVDESLALELLADSNLLSTIGNNFAEDDSLLLELTFGFFAQISQILSVEEVVRIAVPETSDTDYGVLQAVMLSLETSEFGHHELSEKTEIEKLLVEDDTDMHMNSFRKVRTSLLDQKLSALNYISTLINKLSDDLQGLLGSTIVGQIYKKLLDVIDPNRSHPIIQGQGYICLAQLATYIQEDDVDLPDQIIYLTWQMMLDVILQSSVRGVVASACDGLAILLENPNADVLADEEYGLFGSLLEALEALLQGELPCFDDCRDAEELTVYRDSVLSEYTTKVVCAFIDAVDFEEFADDFFPWIAAFLDADRPIDDKLHGLVMLTDMVEKCADFAITNQNDIFDLAKRCLSVNNGDVVSNSCFLFGQLAVSSGEDFDEKIGENAVNLLKDILEKEEVAFRLAVENAMSSILKIYTIFDKNISEFAQHLIAVLPIQADLDEALPLYSGLASLILEENDIIIENKEKVMEILVDLFDENSLLSQKPEVKSLLEEIFTEKKDWLTDIGISF